MGELRSHYLMTDGGSKVSCKMWVEPKPAEDAAALERQQAASRMVQDAVFGTRAEAELGLALPFHELRPNDVTSLSPGVRAEYENEKVAAQDHRSGGRFRPLK